MIWERRFTAMFGNSIHYSDHLIGAYRIFKDRAVIVIQEGKT